MSRKGKEIFFFKPFETITDEILDSYEDVTSDETLSQLLNETKVMTEDQFLAAQRGLVETMYKASSTYINELRTVQEDLRREIRELAQDELTSSQVSLIMSVILLIGVTLLAPVILMFNRNVAVMGEVR